MPTLHRYEVQPNIPAALAPLASLARNVWWSWNESARALFERIDPDLFEQVAENPLALLVRAPQKRLDELAADAVYLAEIARVRSALDAYLTRETWFDRVSKEGPLAGARVGYFSME